MTATTNCFPSGYKEKTWGTYKNVSVYLSGPSEQHNDQYEKCIESMRFLLEKQHSGFCSRVYDHQCGIDGVYQPTLPSGQSFIGTSSYIYSWEILLLNHSVSLDYFDSKAKVICSMSYEEVEKYYDDSNLQQHDDKLSDLIPYFCFLSAYTHVLLEVYTIQWYINTNTITNTSTNTNTNTITITNTITNTNNNTNTITNTNNINEY